MSTFREINNAFLAAFTANELTRLVKFSLDIDLVEVAAESDLSDIVFRLIEWAYRHGRISELIDAAKEESQHPEVQKLSSPTTNGVISSSGLITYSSVGEIGAMDYSSDKFENIEIRMAILEQDVSRLGQIVTGELGDGGIRRSTYANGVKLEQIERMMRAHNWMVRVALVAIGLALVFLYFSGV